MSFIKDEEIHITFEELKQLEIDEIATCIDKYQALSICEKSSAQSTEIFNIWVQKLFKAYDMSEFKNSDWLQVLDFLEKILNKYIQDLSTIDDDKLLQQLNLWWTDTLELLKCTQSIINQIDVQILASILNFVLVVVIKTWRITDKRNIKPVIMIHQKLLDFLAKYLLKTDIQNPEDFNVCNRVLLSLCDVAAMISSTDIKISVETWRSTAKLTNKCNDYYKEIAKMDINQLQIDCTEKPIRGILNEVKKLFQHFVEFDAALNNINFLKVAQFYLQLIKIIMQNSSDSTFSAVKEYFELYTICMHQLKKKNETKVIDYLQNDLHEILHIIYERTDIEECVCQHLLTDNKLCESCDLILDYMQFYLRRERKHILSAATANRIFDIVFDGHLIFADNDKYSKVVLFYVALTAEDATSELHIKLCDNVMECSWIKTYASYEILALFYSHYFKADNGKAFACLEFWIKCWYKFNVTTSTLGTLGPQKFLIEKILQSIVDIKLPQNAMTQIFSKFQHPEILLFKCGQNKANLASYLHPNIIKYLHKIQQMNIQRTEYTELVNLLDIWCRDRLFINVVLIQNDFAKAICTVFSTTLPEFYKFNAILNRFFFLYRNVNNKQLHYTIFTCLRDNMDKTNAASSLFMLNYILRVFSQTEIKSLLTPELQKLQELLKNLESQELDFKSLVDLYDKAITSNTNFALNPSKRLRLGNDCNSSNYKYILNEMLDYSKHLSNASTTLDSNDIELLICIKENIQKCLLK